MEVGYVEEGRKFSGVYVIAQGKDKKAFEEAALEWTDERNTAWTDGFRLEDRRAGCASSVAGDDTTPEAVQKGPSVARPR